MSIKKQISMSEKQRDTTQLFQVRVSQDLYLKLDAKLKKDGLKRRAFIEAAIQIFLKEK